MVVVKVIACNIYIFSYTIFKKKNNMAQAYDTVNSIVGWTERGKYETNLLKMFYGVTKVTGSPLFCDKTKTTSLFISKML